MSPHSFSRSYHTIGNRTKYNGTDVVCEEPATGRTISIDECSSELGLHVNLVVLRPLQLNSQQVSYSRRSRRLNSSGLRANAGAGQTDDKQNNKPPLLLLCAPPAREDTYSTYVRCNTREYAAFPGRLSGHQSTLHLPFQRSSGLNPRKVGRCSSQEADEEQPGAGRRRTGFRDQ